MRQRMRALQKSLSLIISLSSLLLLAEASANGQELSAIEVADSALQEVFALHRLSTVAKGAAKVADTGRQYQLAGNLRNIAGQANGQSASLYGRVVNGLASRRKIQDLKRDFDNFDRYEISNLFRTIERTTGDAGMDYAGAVMTMTGAHNLLKDMLVDAQSSTALYGQRGWICSANDAATEEHPMGHAAVAVDQQAAKTMAMDMCLNIHGRCREVRCQQAF